MTPRAVVTAWVEAFNRSDVDGLAALYAPDAVNHQMAYGPLAGRAAISAMFAMEFNRARMICIVEQLLVDGQWAVLEWRDPGGVRGCGFFLVQGGHIVLQRGYFDRLQFYETQGIDVVQAAATEAAMKQQAIGERTT